MEEIPVTFKSDEEQIVGILHYRGKKAPALIFCHGFFDDKSKPLYVLTARRLARDGFNVLRFDFRGCGDSEGKQEDYCLSEEIKDLMSAIDFLKKRVETDEIGVWGHSHGASVAIIAATQCEEIGCVVASGAITDHEKLWKKNEIEEVERKGYLCYSKDGMLFKVGKRMWMDAKKYKPLHYVRKLRVPILFVHGGEDRIVGVEESRMLYERASAPKELVLIPEAAHSFMNSEEVFERFQEVLSRWFRRSL
jgi:dipeptidyl aminopeptidase/acylaminoacyl peptidase